jgi:hypothetical protein
LSLEAVQLSATLVVVRVPTVNPAGTLGALVSGHALVAAVVVALAERLPAASTASTATVYEVPHTRPLNV